MKITVEYDSLEEFLLYHPSGQAKASRVIPADDFLPEPTTPPEPAKPPELPEPPEPLPATPQEDMRVEPSPSGAKPPVDEEPVGPGSDDPAGDDAKTMEEIRAAFGRMIETDEGYDQGVAMLDKLECLKFADVVATAQLTEFKKLLIEAGAM